MKTNQLNLKTKEKFLELKEFDVTVENLNNAPDPPVFLIKIDSQNIDVGVYFDLDDFVKMNKFLKNIVNKNI